MEKEKFYIEEKGFCNYETRNVETNEVVDNSNFRLEAKETVENEFNGIVIDGLMNIEK